MAVGGSVLVDVLVSVGVGVVVAVDEGVGVMEGVSVGGIAIATAITFPANSIEEVLATQPRLPSPRRI